MRIGSALRRPATLATACLAIACVVPRGLAASEEGWGKAVLPDVARFPLGADGTPSGEEQGGYAVDALASFMAPRNPRPGRPWRWRAPRCL